jgi:hypothetical protein
MVATRLDIPAVAEILGVCPMTIRRAWLDGRLKGARYGRLVRFDPAYIEKIAAEGFPTPPRKAVAAATEAL